MAPTAAYYDGIQVGYRQNGLPVSALKEAWDHAVEEVHAETERINSGFIDRGRRGKGGKKHKR